MVPSSQSSVSIVTATLNYTMTEDSDAFTALLKVLNGLTFDKYSTKFHVLSTKYKHDGDEAVGVDVLVPRHLKSTNRQVSVMVRIHGGFLVCLVQD